MQMDTETLIHGVVQQTMVLIAHLATAGGVRTPLARVADQVFLDLAQELRRQGVSQNVISDMFGLALRTYHRRARTLAASRTDTDRGVWDAVLEHIRDEQPVALRDILMRFRRDDPVVVRGVVHDMTQSGFVYRSGHGDDAVFRLASAGSFRASSERDRREANEYLARMNIYRMGPSTEGALVQATALTPEALLAALQPLLGDGRVTAAVQDGETHYRSPRFEVPVGATQGWEAAVLDHYRSLVSALCVKLRDRPQGALGEATGGATVTLDVWPGHPMEAEARGLLAETRTRVNGLRDRIDAYNGRQQTTPATEAVVFYAGQYVKCDTEGGHDE